MYFNLFFVGLYPKFNSSGMNLKLLVISVLLSLVVGCSASGYSFDPVVSVSDTIAVATFNVRIRTGSDTGVRSWKQRRQHVAALIHRYKLDVAGVQELIDSDQEKELSSALNSYSCVSMGRDNTEGTEGERLALYYLKERYMLVNKGYFFLSETPSVASRGWDAALNRMCQWVELNDKRTNQRFFVFNTHFDHVGKEARAQSARLITARIKEIAGSNTVLLLGDFNANPMETRVYNELSSALYDSRYNAKTKTEPSIGTFNGWKTDTNSFDENVRIDYVFTNRRDKLVEYRVINDSYAEGAYPSDHFPVVVKFSLQH